MIPRVVLESESTDPMAPSRNTQQGVGDELGRQEKQDWDCQALALAPVIPLFPLLLFDAVGERTRHQAALDEHAADAAGGEASDERGQEDIFHMDTCKFLRKSAIKMIIRLIG